MAEIARRQACGGVSRKTIHEWAKSGRLTDGIPWKDVRKKREESAVMVAQTNEIQRHKGAAESQAEFYERALRNMKETFDVIMTKAKAGTIQYSVSDLEVVMRQIALLENQAAEKMKFASFFVRMVMVLLNEELQHEDYLRVTTKLALLQSKVEAELKPTDYIIKSGTP